MFMLNYYFVIFKYILIMEFFINFKNRYLSLILWILKGNHSLLLLIGSFLFILIYLLNSLILNFYFIETCIKIIFFFFLIPLHLYISCKNLINDYIYLKELKLLAYFLIILFFLKFSILSLYCI